MSAKTVLIWPTFSFYHVARFRALHDKLGDNLLGIEFVGGEGDDETGRGHFGGRAGLPIVTLFPHAHMHDLDRRKLGEAAIKKLEEFGAEVVFVNGYSTLELRLIIQWARKNGKKCFTFFETKKNDGRRFFWKEFVKKRIVRGFSGAICGGEIHKKYLISLGMSENRIFPGYDVVDNDFFRTQSALARSGEENKRNEYQLPPKYFLSVSRFVKQKNLERLIAAYDLYKRRLAGGEPWALILCGSGSEERNLKAQVCKGNIRGICFAGIKNPDELAVYYGLAACFILASTREPWGLVVNEAMACGLPVLVTQVAGVAHELVSEGVNGYTFNPFDIEEMAAGMLRIHSSGADKLREMGEFSQRKITFYSPNYFAENILKAVSSCR